MKYNLFEVKITKIKTFIPNLAFKDLISVRRKKVKKCKNQRQLVIIFQEFLSHNL